MIGDVSGMGVLVCSSELTKRAGNVGYRNKPVVLVVRIQKALKRIMRTLTSSCKCGAFQSEFCVVFQGIYTSDGIL